MTLSSLQDLPDYLRRSILTYDVEHDDPAPLVDMLVEWCDGKHPDDLLNLLNVLRERQDYGLSLGLLEAAWNADLSEERLGRIAEDWLGTVRHGLGDLNGAREVAKHLVKTSRDKSDAFVNDLSDLMLSWGYFTEAAPLVRRAAEALPGDLSAQFNLGVVYKFSGEWEAAAAAFRRVLTHQGDDSGTLWNLGIALTALSDWDGARATWSRLGFHLPGDSGEFGADGDLTAVRLRDKTGRAEIIWGLRIGPARVRLTGIPYYIGDYNFDDVVLIDGVSTGEVDGPDEKHPIFDCLGLHTPSGRLKYGLRWPSRDLRLEMMIETLANAGCAVADWRALGEITSYPMAAAPRDIDELASWTRLASDFGLTQDQWFELRE